MEKKTKKSIKEREITEITMVEKELFMNSMTQQELLKTTRELNKTIKELTKTLKIIENNEYLELHRKKWKLVIYNILLGVLFAFGTVFGLVLLSWLTFNFFKDSVILKGIVENQLKIRQIDIGGMQQKIKEETTQKPANQESQKPVGPIKSTDVKIVDPWSPMSGSGK